MPCHERYLGGSSVHPPAVRASWCAHNRHAAARVQRLDHLEDLARNGDGLLDVLVGVRGGHEARLVLRRREVHAALEHGAVPARELGSVALGGVLVVADRPVAEEESEHARDVPAAHLVAGLAAGVENAVDELARQQVELLVRAWPGEDLERLDARRHRERVAREGARLVHGTRRRDHLHDVLTPAVRAHGEAAADDLAHGGEIGGHAKVLLRAAVGDAEAGHHLVEAEQRAVLERERAQPLKEGLVGRDEAGVPDDGLEHHAADLARVRLEERLDRREVVVLCAEGHLGRARGNAGRVGQTERRNARARLHEERVGVAVVAALELDQLLAPRVSAHQPEHAHARLRA
mmetsp:Transcript_34298/g.85468  ORF Transcript_34298/g.85468 Transcript_34298/m.85468 type:complete len:348 (-) Transcript_34298:500-1543(-)